MRFGVLTGVVFLAAALGTSCPASANLIVNGGFETGNFSGWTQTGNTLNDGVTGTFQGVAPASGSYQAYFGAVNSQGGIEQTIATTVGVPTQSASTSPTWAERRAAIQFRSVAPPW